MAAAKTRAAVAPHRVDLIDEDDAGRVLLGLLKHVAHPGSADAHKHFHKIGTGNGEERHLGLPRYGLGQQGLAGAGRTHHQHAAGDLAAQFLELAGVAEKLHQLADFLFRLLHARDIVEGDLDLVLAQQTGPALAKGQRAAAASPLHLPHEVNPHAQQQQDGEPGNKGVDPE